MTETHAKTEAFGRLLTEHQAKLYACVIAMVADAHLAHDLLQETNRVLWENATTFDMERPFLPWAFAVARNQVRSDRKAKARSRLAFDDDVVERLADRVLSRSSSMEPRQIALAECLQELQPKQRDLVDRRYQQGETLQEVAESLGRTASSLGVTMHRVRKTLATCIEATIERRTETR